jgi:anti-anti-sigma factor
LNGVLKRAPVGALPISPSGQERKAGRCLPVVENCDWVYQQREPAIVRLTGEFDIATRSEMCAAFQAAAGNSRVIVDLTAVRYIDSAAIDELFRAAVRSQRLSGRMLLVTHDQRLIRLLSLAGLTDRLTIVDTLEDAHRIFSSSPPNLS